MKLILVIALILAVIASFGDCTPPVKKKPDGSTASSKNKRVSFGAEDKVITGPGDPDDVILLKQKDIDHQSKQKGELYDKASVEKRFADIIVNVINKNSKIFKRISDYVNFFENLELFLSQSMIQTSDRSVLRWFEIKDLRAEKKEFQLKLMGLSDMLSSPHEKVEPLYHLLKSMSAKTKINQNTLNRLDEEAAKVNRIYENFDALFRGFPLEPCLASIKDIRRRIIDAETTSIEDIGDLRKLIAISKTIAENVSRIRETLSKVKRKDFIELSEATNAFYSVASVALNGSGGSSSK